MNNKTVSIVLSVAALVVLVSLYGLNVIGVTESTQYSSSGLQFTVAVPENFEVSERGHRVVFGKLGEFIQLNRQGTNFDNLEDYLLDLDKKNNLNVINTTDMIIGGKSSVFRELLSGDITSKEYRIYIDNQVYSLSTTSPELYDDLDKIAKSFRYTP